MAVWSEVKLSDVKNSYVRLDSEYYRPEYLYSDKVLANFDIYKLKEISNKIDVGFVGTMKPYYCDKGVPLIQTQQVQEYFLNMNEFIQITLDFHKKLIKSQINKGDLIIARSGSFGKASIYLENEVVNSADIIIIKINENIINPLYVLAFLNSKNGSSQLIRFSSGGLQGHVNLTILEDFKIPIIGKTHQDYIASFLLKSYELKKISQSLYNQAQVLLERELGLDNSSLNCFSNIFGTSFNELIDSRRLDSEYYNPKVKSMVKRISTSKNTNVKSNFSIKNGFPWYSKKFLEDNSGEPVVRIRDIKPTYIDNEELTSIDSSYCNTINFAKSQTGDIAVGMDGLKYFYASIIEESCYINQRVCHLTPKLDSIISPEYLTFIINSSVGQSQLLRDMTIATTVGHITNQNIANLLIPIVSNEFHDNITNLVRRSIDAKKDSKILLEQAKRRVEELIEQAVEK